MMLLLDKAPLWPAACVCGGTDGPLLDTGLEDVDSGRRVYLCRHHFLEAALAGDLVSKSELLEALEKLRTATDRANTLGGVLVTQEQRIAELERSLEQERARASSHASNVVHLERRITQLQLDPATIARQSLIAQLQELAAGNGHRT
jgi:hypothetical protein